MRSTIEGDAKNLGISLSGYVFDRVTVAGLTNGGADTQTETYFNIGNDPNAWNGLLKHLGAAGFVDAGYDPLHGQYDHSYRQQTTNGTWSMQVSYDSNHNLQIDIDPHNPMQSMFAHSIDVLFNAMTGRDTNYLTAGSSLNMSVNPCK